MVEGSPIIWPHQVRNQLPTIKDVRKILRERPDLKNDYWRVLRRTALNAVPARYSSGKLTELNQQHTMGFVNGEESKPVADKYQFNEIVRGLGYRAPNQFLVPANNQLPDIDKQLDELGEMILIKPRKGGQGGKIKVVPKKEVKVLIKNPKDDLIVQELVTPDSEYRYVLLNEKDQKLRLCFERVLPRVTGDGKSSVLKLIQRSDMPAESKAINLINNRKSLRMIPPEGETLILSHVVNIPSGGYERYPDESIVPNLDRFFEQFIIDLQNKLGIQFLLSSFDFGVIDTSVLRGEYDFEKMKQNIVFFESQMPFGFEGYTRNIPNATPLEKVRTEIGFLAEVVKARNARS